MRQVVLIFFICCVVIINSSRGDDVNTNENEEEVKRKELLPGVTEEGVLEGQQGVVSDDYILDLTTTTCAALKLTVSWHLHPDDNDVLSGLRNDTSTNGTLVTINGPNGNVWEIKSPRLAQSFWLYPSTPVSPWREAQKNVITDPTVIAPADAPPPSGVFENGVYNISVSIDNGDATYSITALLKQWQNYDSSRLPELDSGTIEAMITPPDAGWMSMPGDASAFSRVLFSPVVLYANIDSLPADNSEITERAIAKGDDDDDDDDDDYSHHSVRKVILEEDTPQTRVESVSGPDIVGAGIEGQSKIIPRGSTAYVARVRYYVYVKKAGPQDTMVNSNMTSPEGVLHHSSSIGFMDQLNVLDVGVVIATNDGLVGEIPPMMHIEFRSGFMEESLFINLYAVLVDSDEAEMSPLDAIVYAPIVLVMGESMIEFFQMLFVIFIVAVCAPVFVVMLLAFYNGIMRLCGGSARLITGEPPANRMNIAELLRLADPGPSGFGEPFGDLGVGIWRQHQAALAANRRASVPFYRVLVDSDSGKVVDPSTDPAWAPLLLAGNDNTTGGDGSPGGANVEDTTNTTTA